MLEDLNSKLAQYKSLKTNLNSLLSYLKKTKNPLKTAAESIGTNYVFNDTAADNGNILVEYNRINRVINTLENTIIPHINSEISTLQASLADATAAQMLVM